MGVSVPRPQVHLPSPPGLDFTNLAHGSSHLHSSFPPIFSSKFQPLHSPPDPQTTHVAPPARASILLSSATAFCHHTSSPDPSPCVLPAIFLLQEIPFNPVVTPYHALSPIPPSSLSFTSMSEYLPSFIVEPVLRQARRFSESPGLNLPAVSVPDLQRWNPSRLWATSPSSDLDDDNHQGSREESTVQSLTRTLQLWANQFNDLETEPTPPLGPMDDLNPPSHDLQDPLVLSDFPTLPSPTLPPPRNDSETSLNPAQELSNRSRAHHGSTSRPHSSSDPRGAVMSLDDTPSTPMSPGSAAGTARRWRDASGPIPEDDGMFPLRKRITAVWDGPGTAAEKSRLVHGMMMEGYQHRRSGRPISSSTTTTARGSWPGPDTPSSASILSRSRAESLNYNLGPEDLRPTYAPLDDPPQDDQIAQTVLGTSKPDLGCIHYKRNVKMQCNTCQRWYTCRLCHDEIEDHTLPRRETKHMLCMLCKSPQPVSQFCKSCDVAAACYYCSVCKLWNNDPNKSIYHCDDCGICRLGEGLGKDFFHCKTCAACMSIQAESTHKCIERSTKCDCPICGDYMFTSNKPVAFMRCGHSIHESCFTEWCNTSYKCPICSRSIANMESQFRRLDRHIEEQPMPDEYRDNRAYIFCNDCNSRSITKYHWLGVKCAICESYNTTQLELLGAEQTPQLQEQQERAQQRGVSEAALTASQTHTPTGELVQTIESPSVLAIPGAAAQPVPINDPAVLPATPVNTSPPWLLPHSPSTRSARSVSPVVGSYFGTGNRDLAGAVTSPAPRRGTTPLEDDDDLDFWGRPNSPSHPTADRPEESDSEESDSTNELMEDDGDDEEEDAMNIFGHR